MFHILLVEDEIGLRKLIKYNLEKRGYFVYESSNGKDALTLINNSKIDLIVTDIMMPIMDGNQLISKIKLKNSDLPIIMLTALNTIEDKKKSFEGGADDYLTKPVNFDELDLRIRALLRRYGRVSKLKLQIGNTELNYLEKTLKVDNSIVETTKKEFLLLYTLCSCLERIYSRSQLLDDIWGITSESLDRTVDVHISRLREKLSQSDIVISSIRGLGYKAELK